jgi:hypothetical protein
MTDKSKIAIITTVASFKLYNKTATLFPKGIDKIVIDGTTGMYGLNSIEFMFEKFKSKNYDWIIMADEDVFFYDANLVFELIEYMDEHNFDICGIRDGGEIEHRFHNPEAINTFFSILNFKKISVKYEYRLILDCQKYIPELYANKDYSVLKYSYDLQSLKEPYYCFYFWAHLNHFKFLYLDTINPVGDDMIGNVILSPTGEKMAFHSWYARVYEVYEDQTVRLNSFLKDFNIEEALVDWNNVQVLNKPFFNWKKRMKKFIKKNIFFNK